MTIVPSISSFIKRIALFAVFATTSICQAATPATLPTIADAIGSNSLSWTAGHALPIEMPASLDYQHIALKDPSVVRAKDAWHVYASWTRFTGGKTRYGLAYFSCRDWNQLEKIVATPLLSDRTASAPQVFYFSPQQKWYLFYKVHDASPKREGFCFSTLADVDQPTSITQPQLCDIPFDPPAGEIDSSRGLDSFFIGDGRNVYLFYSDNRGHQFRTQTSYANFPQGWAAPIVVASGARADVFEGCCVYRLKDQNRFMMIIEAIGKEGSRYFRTYMADRLDGEWKSTGSSFANPFVGMTNTRFASGVTPWTVHISHGELIRGGFDERMVLDTDHLQFLIQGWDGKSYLPNIPLGKFNGYHERPWKLGVLDAAVAPLAGVTSNPASAVPAPSGLSLPKIFGSDMVLQRSDHTAIWGKASPGETIKVQLSSNAAAIAQETTTHADGKWKLHLDLSKCSDVPATLTVIGGDNKKIELTNILIGDVWLCTGQSNMQYAVKLTANAPREIADANYSSIRLFSVKTKVSREPLDDVEGKWVVCSPKVVGDFSASGYYFGRELWNARHVPLGLVSDCFGGTPAEAWTSLPSLKAGGKKFANMLNQRDTQLATDKVVLATRPTTQPAFTKHSAGALYDAMINPILPLTVKGAVWYQGESNASRAALYEPLLATMIADWRRGFACGDFPFIIAQIANYSGHTAKTPDEQWVQPAPADNSWAELRECQAIVARDVPNCGLVVTFDIGEIFDIHPKNKQDVGRRLALVARKIAYGESDLIASGPVYKSADFTNGKAVITFDSVGGGLTAKGEKLEGFAICADSDPAGKHIWKWADARIEGDQVIVWRPDVPHPVAVRYAWAATCPANLYNKAGLPAVPFRTDHFPRLTELER